MRCATKSVVQASTRHLSCPTAIGVAEAVTHVQMEAEQPPDVDGVLTLLRVHDRSARDTAFAAELHRCAVCLDEHPGSQGIRPPCGHWHCTECMRAMAVTFMHASDPMAIRCPQPDCRTQLGPETLQELLDAEQMARWDSLMLQRALAKMSDVVFCPRCEVAAVEHAEWAMCPGCNYAFCALCYDAYHPGVQCATLEQKLRILDERSKRMDGSDKVYTARVRSQPPPHVSAWLHVVSRPPVGAF